ncbi:peptidoglycan-recognition protein SA-like [Teleopsis dalmanni]|uniref:peptidoglycan-recognition protein SA-like n=1 Tax=Teleopsis dalmanni TaxID=139649 RepID=UPI0018CD7F7C|nr:peptidoglycan-recognition protein SA-like [Teleopsis dalmanni]
MYKVLLIWLGILCTLVATSPRSDCPRMKSKRQWGAKIANEVNYQVKPVHFVIIHHTVTEECSKFPECSELLQNMQHSQMTTQKFDDIAYNFMIASDGTVYEGRGWGKSGAHTYGYNAKGLGIAFIGNFIEKLPSRSALNAAKKLLSCGVKRGELDKQYQLLGATQVSATKSPGITLYNEIQKWEHWVPNP